jgi:hypothetical protein
VIVIDADLKAAALWLDNDGDIPLDRLTPSA